MKTFLLILIISMMGCISPPEKTIQVESAIVEITEMEPFFRNGVEAGCKITWFDRYNNVYYLSFDRDYCDYFIMGVKYKVLIRR